MPIDWSELERHRVVQVKAKRIRTHFPRLLGYNARLCEHGFGNDVLVREVVTDHGASGWGLSGGRWPDGTVELAGTPVSDLFDPAVGVIREDAMPLDAALHDLAGVICGAPVHQMLGGAGGRDIPCYGAMGYMDDITPAYAPGGVAVILRHCRDDYNLGYRAFKLKMGRGYQWMDAEAGLRRDIEVTRAVREAFPEAQLIVDPNDGYDCDTAVRYVEAVGDCRLFSIEEPFPENRTDLLRLREAIEKHCPDTTVTDGESRPDVDLLVELGAEGLIDILNLDIQGYGFTPWRRAAPRALAAGMLLTPHTFGLRIKTFYGAQFLAGVGGVSPLEGVIDETEGVDAGAYSFANGILRVPDAPGFGLRLIWGREIGPDGRADYGRRPVTPG